MSRNYAALEEHGVNPGGPASGKHQGCAVVSTSAHWLGDWAADQGTD
jgi:hypothetical protein